jgi:type I restriction enzyme S subunit
MGPRAGDSGDAQERDEGLRWWRMYKKYEKMKDSGVEWIGEIPEHWDEYKLKHIAWVQSSNVDKLSEKHEIPVMLCNYTDVYYNDTIVNNLQFMQATATAEEIEKFTLRKDDILITKDSETPDDIAVSALVKSDLPGVLCGYHLSHIRPNRQNVLGNFLNRAFSASGLNDQFKVAATGVIRFGIGKQSIASSLFPIPPLSEQRAIAAFLDRETTRIDALIEMKERLIELLKEKRQSLITRAVTKGLDPNVKMKDSGVEWIGMIPEGWEVRKLKYIASMKAGESITSDDINNEGEYPVFGGNGLRGYTSSYTHKGNYVLIGRQGALCGNVNYASNKFWASEHAIVVSPKIEVDVYWLGELMFAMNLNQYSISAAQPGISVDVIQNLSIPFPALIEQKSIATILKTNCQLIDSISLKIQSQIDKLRDFRQTLISNAVTGKIDVREEVSA